VVIMAWW